MAWMVAGAGLALLGLVTGALWRIPAIEAREAAILLRLNRADAPMTIDRALGAVRILGSTAFSVAVLVVVAALRPSWALGLAVAALLSEGIAKGVKLALRRPRPFDQHENVIVRLPSRPTDPAYPSADAMRAAFLAGLATVTLPAVPGALCAALAVIVGLARVRAGAHYLLDVGAGWCLGLGICLAWMGWIFR